MSDENTKATETPAGAASALSAGLGFTLLMVKASEPHFDIRTEKTIHRILVKFAKTSKVKIDTRTIEVSTHDIEDFFIDFAVGDSVLSFSNGLRNLADALDALPNKEVRGD